MIIAVGFKVNNERAVQFRKWANGIVKDYTIKGWVMDDERTAKTTKKFFAKVQNKMHYAVHGYTVAEFPNSFAITFTIFSVLPVGLK